MKGPERLRQFEYRWETDKGKWFPGERVVFRGKDLCTEVRDMGWMGMMLLGVTGKVLPAKTIQLFELIMTFTGSFPDPRLWNNRIAALAGTTRSTANLGVSGANAVSEATIYGFRPITKALEFIQRLHRLNLPEDSLEGFVIGELRAKKTIGGYGRPITRADERNQPLIDGARKLGIEPGPHVKLAFKVEQILQESRYKIGMNNAGLVAAYIADQNISVPDYCRIVTVIFLGGFLPCYIDGLEKPEGMFFPYSCERINYKGKGKRAWSGG